MPPPICPPKARPPPPEPTTRLRRRASPPPPKQNALSETPTEERGAPRRAELCDVSASRVARSAMMVRSSEGSCAPALPACDAGAAPRQRSGHTVVAVIGASLSDSRDGARAEGGREAHATAPPRLRRASRVCSLSASAVSHAPGGVARAWLRGRGAGGCGALLSTRPHLRGWFDRAALGVAISMTRRPHDHCVWLERIVARSCVVNCAAAAVTEECAVRRASQRPVESERHQRSTRVVGSAIPTTGVGAFERRSGSRRV